MSEPRTAKPVQPVNDDCCNVYYFEPDVSGFDAKCRQDDRRFPVTDMEK